MVINTCTLSTPALAAFLLLPSLLGLGTVATTSRGNLATLQAAPLAAGSLAGLLILSHPSVPVILAVGALATIPLLLVLCRPHSPISTVDGYPQTRKDKPVPLTSLESRLSPWSADAHTPTTVSALCTPADSDSEDTFCSGYLDKVTASLPQCSRVPSRSLVPPTMLNGALLSYSATPVTAVSSASTTASSTHNNVLVNAQASPLLPAPTFEEEFTRYIDRALTRARPEKAPVPFGSWPKEWPMFWEGAGLAPKGCW
ncbi:uncharacterized protein CcaverHIS019_0503350 [Cutaneotrichosporon cavernicola]|uniref:Uncharacterized protein n=1 Tax=Cutaneotrichosporon cavernicola TaxID=279322 RepID=A0AA48L696_9TREE|nr:uncharacterized protein CcaverHIS019_0503350 [Cutaneotrichosporon cavernicola]BEI92707.1 hypothetical protein CcaverHIS019_0503350 [Cutaneotrichosporon cavernicola]BEJ00484.1 hypothetical protein CcaverHIS631_0503410 [Cutaneotrichosporon cavernicola]BEJ08253.1 hypothetical protein CcaverHIS641_0503380 [Cutaneotrichosporon cavernicola]